MNWKIKHLLLRRNRFKKIIALIAFISSGLMGCASMIQGVNQNIKFEMEPPKTQCILYDESGLLVAARIFNADEVQVSKGSADLLANCSAQGYQDLKIQIRSTVQPIGIVEILIDFGITDMLTGAMWAYPDKVFVSLVSSVNPEDMVKSSGAAR